jgi:hypothetical protein
VERILSNALSAAWRQCTSGFAGSKRQFADLYLTFRRSGEPIFDLFSEQIAGFADGLPGVRTLLLCR